MNRRLRLVAFLIVFIAVLTVVQASLIMERDSYKRMKGFYREPENSLDVIFMGASHVAQGVNPFIIWRETGVPSHVIAQASQNNAGNWHYLNEMLKTQHPKVVFLETRFLILNNGMAGKLDNDSFFSIDALRFSPEKLQAAMDVYSIEDFFKYSLFPIVNYHTVWKKWVRDGVDLVQGEYAAVPFIEDPAFTKGFRGYHLTYDYNPEQLVSVKDDAVSAKPGPLRGDSLIYLEKIIGLCKENNIRLVLFSIPYPAVETNPADPLFEQSLEKIAVDNNIERLELSGKSSQLGLDWYQDLYDLEHLNVKGAGIFTSAVSDYIGKHLAEYALSDKRADPSYASWNTDAETFFRVSSTMPMLPSDEN